MLIAALFRIARTWKQLICPSTEKYIKKMWYTYTMEYSLALEKNKQCLCSNIDGPRDFHTKGYKSDRGRQIL